MKGIPYTATNVERFLTQCLPSHVLAPVVIGPAEVAENDAELPFVADGPGNRQRLFLKGNGAIVIALTIGNVSKIVQATRDIGLIFYGAEPCQRLFKEQCRRREIALIAGENSEPTQGTDRDFGVLQLLSDRQTLLEIVLRLFVVTLIPGDHPGPAKCDCAVTRLGECAGLEYAFQPRSLPDPIRALRPERPKCAGQPQCRVWLSIDRPGKSCPQVVVFDFNAIE